MVGVRSTGLEAVGLDDRDIPGALLQNLADGSQDADGGIGSVDLVRALSAQIRLDNDLRS